MASLPGIPSNSLAAPIDASAIVSSVLAQTHRYRYELGNEGVGSGTAVASLNSEQPQKAYLLAVFWALLLTVKQDTVKIFWKGISQIRIP